VASGAELTAHGDYAQAAEELRTAVRRNPTDKDAERELNRFEAAKKGNSETKSPPKSN
jgi:Flp pilus assembly protein TadD